MNDLPVAQALPSAGVAHSPVPPPPPLPFVLRYSAPSIYVLLVSAFVSVLCVARPLHPRGLSWYIDGGICQAIFCSLSLMATLLLFALLRSHHKFQQRLAPREHARLWNL